MEEIEARVSSIKTELEQFLYTTLYMEHGVQDAEYITGLSSEDRVLCIRFSAWGNLFTVWDDDWDENLLSTDDFEPIIALIERHGFIHVDYDEELSEKYDGHNEFYKREKHDYFRDGKFRKESACWWTRYFDYT